MAIKYLKLALLTVISVIWTGCEKDQPNDIYYDDIVMYVSETTVWDAAGIGDAPAVEYMQVREAQSSEWKKLAMGSIKGFDYTHGHAYELEVRKITLANPPADGPNTSYALIRIINDTYIETPEQPDELPDEAKFKLKMAQLTPFMNLDTKLAAPFDFLTFKILNHKDEYNFPGKPEFLQYYDSIVMSSPILPDTYCVYQNKSDENGSYEKFTAQWSSYFFEKSDFTISLKGYKGNDVIYEFSTNQIMRERDFLGVDWKNGNITIINPRTTLVYSILDTHYEFLITDTQMIDDIGYVMIKVADSSGLTNAEYLKEQETGLRWLLKKHLGEKTFINTDDFKTLPENTDIVETYENNATRAALLHKKGSATHEECYIVIAESK